MEKFIGAKVTEFFALSVLLNPVVRNTMVHKENWQLCSEFSFFIMQFLLQHTM